MSGAARVARGGVLYELLPAGDDTARKVAGGRLRAAAAYWQAARDPAVVAAGGGPRLPLTALLDYKGRRVVVAAGGTVSFCCGTPFCIPIETPATGRGGGQQNNILADGDPRPKARLGAAVAHDDERHQPLHQPLRRPPAAARIHRAGSPGSRTHQARPLLTNALVHLCRLPPAPGFGVKSSRGAGADASLLGGPLRRHWAATVPAVGWPHQAAAATAAGRGDNVELGPLVVVPRRQRRELAASIICIDGRAGEGGVGWLVADGGALHPQREDGRHGRRRPDQHVRGVKAARHLALNMFCQYIYLRVYVIPAADL